MKTKKLTPKLKHPKQKKQKGMALLTALIMLTLMTVICLATFNIGKNSMDVITNMQHRNEVTAAATNAIEQAMSTKRLFSSPSTIFLNPCNAQNTLCYDLNGDGVNDITVALTPTPSCSQSQSIPNASLNYTNPEDLGCIMGSPDQWGTEGVPAGNSMCANTVWDINAVAQDTVTGANMTVSEGVAVRVASTDADTSCP